VRILFHEADSAGPPVGDLVARAIADGRRLRRIRTAKAAGFGVVVVALAAWVCLGTASLCL
jgi:hypothetical protein